MGDVLSLRRIKKNGEKEVVGLGDKMKK